MLSVARYFVRGVISFEVGAGALSSVGRFFVRGVISFGVGLTDGKKGFGFPAGFGLTTVELASTDLLSGRVGVGRTAFAGTAGGVGDSGMTVTGGRGSSGGKAIFGGGCLLRSFNS